MTLTWTIDGAHPNPASWSTMAGFPRLPTHDTGLVRDQVRITHPTKGRPRGHLTGKTGALVKWLCLHGPATAEAATAGTGEKARATYARLWELSRQGRLFHDPGTRTWRAADAEILSHAATIPPEGCPAGSPGEQPACTPTSPGHTSEARSSPAP